MRHWTALLLFAGSVLRAQTPSPPQEAVKPVIENTGKPMRVPFQCTEQDVDNAGMSCTEEEPCPVYLELSGVANVGNRLFVAGNIHSASATLYSILLSSDDIGKTWREPYERLQGAGLEHIQFLDFQAGWISGQSLQPLPKDPFFLITDDGGKSWRQRPMFSESRVGTVQQFWFDTRKTGVLIMDRAQSGESGARYEKYETMTGGESWMLREGSDRPIRLPRSPNRTEELGWRIHADAASKAFRIEKRQGEGWNPVASFLVTVGECKPTPRPVVEPPPALP